MRVWIQDEFNRLFNQMSSLDWNQWVEILLGCSPTVGCVCVVEFAIRQMSRRIQKQAQKQHLSWNFNPLGVDFSQPRARKVSGFKHLHSQSLAAAGLAALLQWPLHLLTSSYPHLLPMHSNEWPVPGDQTEACVSWRCDSWQTIGRERFGTRSEGWCFEVLSPGRRKQGIRSCVRTSWCSSLPEMILQPRWCVLSHPPGVVHLEPGLYLWKEEVGEKARIISLQRTEQRQWAECNNEEKTNSAAKNKRRTPMETQVKNTSSKECKLQRVRLRKRSVVSTRGRLAIALCMSHHS